MPELVRLEADDFCCFERIDVPLYKQGLIWLFGDNRDTEAATSNGAGKSTVFKALCWAAYGQSPDGERGDKVIRAGATCAKTVLHFEEGWRVERERRRGAPRVSLYRGETAIPGGKEIQDHIDKLMGMDWSTFHHAALYAQRDRSRFVDPSLKDADRKEVLHKILRTALLSLAHDWIKKRNLELKRLCDELSTQIAKENAAREEHDLDVLAADMELWSERRTEQVRLFKKEAADLTATAKALKAQNLEKREQQLAALKAERDSVKTDDPQAHDRAVMAASRLAIAQKACDVAERDITDAEGDLKQLAGERCPLCRGSLKAEHAAKHLERLRDRVAEAKERSKTAASQLAAAKKAHAAAEATAARARASAHKVRTLGLKIEALVEEIAEGKAIVRRRTDLAARARSRLEDAKRAAAEANPHKEALEKARKRVKEIDVKIASLRKKEKEHTRSRAHHEFWVRGFGPSGLPSFILDSTMPFLTERANHYLEVLSDGDISMSFSTQRELKSAKGEFRDEIDISWTVEGVDDYPPSNGQWKKMEIATDMALMDLVAQREGSQVDLLCLDEVLDGLDEEGSQRIVQLLHELRRSRGTIIVISHNPSMAEAFERSWIVIKSDGTSRLEVS